MLVRRILEDCAKAQLPTAYTGMKGLCDMGYSAMDIITTLFKVRREGAL